VKDLGGLEQQVRGMVRPTARAVFKLLALVARFVPERE
jgi:hypothetical protein